MVSLPNLKALRLKRFWSQKDLAGKSGVALSTIVRLERGEPAHYVTARKLAEALGVLPEELVRPVEGSERAVS